MFFNFFFVKMNFLENKIKHFEISPKYVHNMSEIENLSKNYALGACVQTDGKLPSPVRKRRKNKN